MNDTAKYEEKLKGAIYNLVFQLSENSMNVSMPNVGDRALLHDIRTVFQNIARIMNDDEICVEVEMDCSKDEEIARSLANNTTRRNRRR
jgi:hypothetical protein